MPLNLNLDIELTANALAVEIGTTELKIVYGSKNKIKCFKTVKLAEQGLMEDKAADLDTIKLSIEEFIHANNIRTKNIYFAIHRQDIFVRHTESPIMPDKAIRDSIEWEIGQTLPEGGEGHYIDFEIVQTINTKEKKLYKLMVVAVPKERVDNLLTLSEELNLKLQAVDISANCVSRVFKEAGKTYPAIGVINFGTSTSSFIIMEKGKLFIEREVPFGVNNIINEISRRTTMSAEAAITYVKKELDFAIRNENDEIQRRIQTLFDNVFGSFIKVVQFYTTGKTQKELDQLYMIGAAKNLKGLPDFSKSYFNTNVELADSPAKLYRKINLPEGMDFISYLGPIGLLLRKE